MSLAYDDDDNYVRTPPVVIWFKIYAGFLSLLYLLVSAGFLVMIFIDPEDPEMPRPVFQVLMGLMGLLCLVLLVVCFLPLVLPRRPWVWIYDLVIICLGLSSPCFMVVCIPLLIFWLSPETKRYFGRT